MTRIGSDIDGDGRCLEPLASTRVSSADASKFPTAAMRSPTTRTFMSRDGPPLPSITRALTITTPAGPDTSGAQAVSANAMLDRIARDVLIIDRLRKKK
jgi:hypothetical protein